MLQHTASFYDIRSSMILPNDRVICVAVWKRVALSMAGRDFVLAPLSSSVVHRASLAVCLAS